MKRHSLIKLIPPRPFFALDMTNEEKRLMQEHVVYWTGLADKGVALLLVPCLIRLAHTESVSSKSRTRWNSSPYRERSCSLSQAANFGMRPVRCHKW